MAQARALRIDREAGRPDDVDFAGAVYCNVAAALLKLDRWDRAEQAASRAIKHCDFARARATEARIRMDRLADVGELDELDESHPALTRRLLDDATRRKALYRRALAREKCRRGLEAHQDCVEARRLADAVKSGATAGEKNLLRREQLRLGKVKAAFDEQLKQRALRKAEEAAVAYTGRVDIPRTNRGDAAVATWIFRGDDSRRRRGCDLDIPRRRFAATPRLRRG